MQVFPLARSFSVALWLALLVEELCSANRLRRRHLVNENELLARYPGQDDYISPTAHVIGVEGGDTSLPCDLRAPSKNDPPLLVLWYRSDAPKPIYSYDIRRGSPQHWESSVYLGKRATFEPSRAVLLIRKVTSSDADLYKCRVDFKVHQTVSFSVNLTVIIPPQRLWIESPTELENGSVVGPYQKGDSLRLRCESLGGRPPPSVTWWDGFRLLDDQSEISSEQQTANILVLKHLTRQDLNRKITCRANNTDLTPPLQTSVTIDMIFAPREVRILSSKDPLSAGMTYEVSCQSRGSKPSAQIHWEINSVTIENSEVRTTVEGAVTRSLLHFTPRKTDNQNILRCVAIVPGIPNLPVIDIWNLNIHYLPKVTIQLGSFLDPNNIKEGDSLYFECVIDANPPAYKIVWYHQDKELSPNKSRGVVRSNMTLVIQNVQTNFSGKFTCQASNIEGDGIAPSMEIAVKYAPVCTEKQTFFFGVSPEEEIEIDCSVDSFPDPQSFTWMFNNSGDSSVIPQSQVTSGRFVSTVRYTPRAETDYGTLLCFATNGLGKQKKACYFHIFPAGRPDPVAGCVQFNLSETSISVRCLPGFDGGIPQVFFIELFHQNSRKLLRKVSNSIPEFLVVPLNSSTMYDAQVFPANSKGTGDKYELKVYTLKYDAEKRTAAIKPAPESTRNILSSMLVPAVGIGILILLLLVGLVVFGFIRGRRQRLTPDKDQVHRRETPDAHELMIDKSSPDIIPNKGDRAYVDGGFGIAAISTSNKSSFSEPLMTAALGESIKEASMSNYRPKTGTASPPK